MCVAASESMTEVEYSDQAVENLESLEPEIAERVMDKVDEATEWTEHRLVRLTNSSLYKVRAGDYRALVNWKQDKDQLFVVAVGHRRNVYDRNL